MCIMADFQAMQCEEARIIQDMPETQKCCFEPVQAGSSCHDEGFYVHRSVGGKNANDCFKYLSLCQNESFS